MRFSSVYQRSVALLLWFKAAHALVVWWQPVNAMPMFYDDHVDHTIWKGTT